MSSPVALIAGATERERREADARQKLGIAAWVIFSFSQPTQWRAECSYRSALASRRPVDSAFEQAACLADFSAKLRLRARWRAVTRAPRSGPWANRRSARKMLNRGDENDQHRDQPPAAWA
jgi:hypothetical protein